MKILFFVFTYFVLLDAGCKHQAATVSTNPDSSKGAVVDSSEHQNRMEENKKTKGKVSHRYASKGCAVVIIVSMDNGEEMVLIPKTPLENKFDKDGLELYFNYHPLRMMQPQGCESGIPAEITDVSLK